MVTQSHERHTVQVFETDGFLSQRVVEFLGAGLAASNRCVVIATDTHRRLFGEGLTRIGTDVRGALESGQLVMLDAQATLDMFMIDGQPDPQRFERVVGALISSLAQGGHRIRAFGEMVDVLWRGGSAEAAIELEHLWNELARRHPFDLLCAYTMANFYKTSSAGFREVCEVHDHVAPLEIVNETSSRASEEMRLLLGEIARRADVERELREAIDALRRSEEAERARALRAAQLQQATGTLASAITLGELSDLILQTSTNLAGAVGAVVYLVDADGRIRLHGEHNAGPSAEKWRVLPRDAPVPLARTIATGKSIWLESRQQVAREYPDILFHGKTQAVASLPLVYNGRVIGGIGMSFETARAFSDEERNWLEAYAGQCALAVERTRLYTAEQKARTEAETLLRIAESLNNAHLDLEAILRRVTDEATALVGAQYGAFFYNVQQGGESTMFYTVTGARIPRNVPIESFESIVRIDDARSDPRYDMLPVGHGPIASYLAVPVRSRTGKMIGGLVFGHPEPNRFTSQHEALLRGLSVTAAVAVDNAELYRAARDAEDAQRKTVEQLVDTVRMNELFTGVLAHDLRSPLAAVMTAIQVMLLKAGSGEKRTAERILESARRMARMIEQLLDFTRIRMGTGLPLEPKPVDLDRVVTNVVEEARTAHPNSDIRLATEGDLSGQWDDDRLAQALSNLLGNAVQHGRPEAGVDVHVDGAEPDTVYITIKNAGSIPEEMQSRIFEPLIGGQRRHDGTRGLGLGLYITREIAASHGGLISLSSSPDAGTTFTMTLPRIVEPVEYAPRELSPMRSSDRPFELEHRMRTLVEGTRDIAVFSVDANHHITSWSHTGELFTGWNREDIAMQSLATLFPPEERIVLDAQVGRAAKLGLAEHEGWFARKDGLRFWGALSLSALRGGSGDLVGYAAVLRDLDEKHRAQQAVEEAVARTRLMIDSVRDYAIFSLDTEGRVRSWSRGAQMMKGYTPGEILGRHISTFYTREDKDSRPQMLLKKAVDEGRVEDEGWRVRKDGSRFWADVVISAVRDDDGVLRGFTKVTRDLTARRKAEEELRRSEERFRLMVETVKDYAIFMLDPTGHIVTWNAGAERTKGYKAQEIVGEHFSKFYLPEDVRAGKCERELEIAITEKRFEDEGWRVRKDGSRFWANVVITALRDATGELLGFAKVTRDLSERRQLEEERMAFAQAQEGIRLRDEFLSIVSHELKTPLAGLLLQIDAIARRTDERTRDQLVRVREAGGRLDNLIESLLDVSRIATGRFVLDRQRFDLVELVRETVQSFQAAATRGSSELVIEAPGPLFGAWDRVRLGQVLANLLSNSLKYGAGRPIHISISRSGNDVVVMVRDFGPGIDPTMLTRVFERFERAVSSRHFGGLGIGLYVVREIITAHGGTVAAENMPDGGARFRLQFPVEAP